MLKILSEKELAGFVAEHSVDDQICFGVSFWGNDAEKRLGLKKARGGKILCNLESGCCNPDEIKKLIGRFEVKTHRKLHGKMYRFKNLAVIGSSNASINGLAIDGQTNGWRELNVALDDKASLVEVDKWFAALWKEGRDVDAGVVEEFRKIWNDRQIAARQPPAVDGIVTAGRSDRQFFDNKPIVLLMSRAAVDPVDRAEIKEFVESGEAGEEFKDKRYWAYVDWKKFPPETWFIDMTIRKIARVSGVARSGDKLCVKKLTSGRKAQLLSLRRSIVIEKTRYSLPPADRQILCDHARELWDAAEGDESGRFLAFPEALAVLK